MVKQEGHKLVAQNKKARHDYLIEDTYEAGIVLQGTEVKSLRAGRASLVDGFVEIDEHEAWLHGVHIPEYTQGTWTNHARARKRKLLLNRAEIDKIERRVNERGLTIVPLSLYFKDGRAKIEIAWPRARRPTTSGTRWPSGRRTGRPSRRSAAGSRAAALAEPDARELTDADVPAWWAASGCPGCSTCTCTSCRRR